MSYNNKPWNNNGNAGIRENHNFSGRPPFNGENGNMRLQNPRNPQMGPPPQCQLFQSYSNIHEPHFTGNSLYMPQRSQFQNPPPPSQPPLTFPNPPLHQSFSVPPPNHSIRAMGQPLPPRGRPGALPNLDMKYGPPPLPTHGPYQHIPNHPFPSHPPHRFPADHLHHPVTGYKTVSQHEGIHDSKIGIIVGRQELDNKELGTQKLEKWLQKIGKSKRPQLKGQTKKKSSEQIWKSIDQLRVMTQLISSMSADLKEMTDCASSVSIATWGTMTCRLEEFKEKYTRLEPSLDESSVQNMEEKLLKMRLKRARLRQARVSKFEEDLTLTESWVERGQRIDRWQERHRAKIKEENLRKSRKAAADRTLSKVTREIQDASRLIETMLAIQKLRLVRRDTAQKRGDADLGESRQTFEQKIVDMTRLVQSQLEHYKEEEAKLKQVIKSEQEENTEKERLLQIEKEKQKQREEDEEIQTMLFGPIEEMTDSDPRLPYVQYYRQAENSFQAFLQIRHDWDAFLVPENSPTSSAIPSSWILPEPPGSAIWATTLK